MRNVAVGMPGKDRRWRRNNPTRNKFTMGAKILKLWQRMDRNQRAAICTVLVFGYVALCVGGVMFFTR